MGTSIGGAIKQAIKLLKTTGPADLYDSGGSIILLTDGEETSTPTIKEIWDVSVIILLQQNFIL